MGISGRLAAPGVVPAGGTGRGLDCGTMPAVLSGVVLAAAFAAIAVLGTILAVAAFRRAGAREATHGRDQRLS
jgi:hypothetical protein